MDSDVGAAVQAAVPKPLLEEEFFEPCEMCGMFTPIRIKFGKTESALCTPHAQAAIIHMLKRGFKTITFSK